MFDLYAHPTKGVMLWLVGEDGKRYFFYQDFEIIFYAGGSLARLRELWRFLQAKSVKLARIQREDLYVGAKDVMEIRVPTFSIFTEIFREASRSFPDLEYYDADIPLYLRHAAAFKVFPLAYCEITAEPNGKLTNIAVLNTPWEVDAYLPPLRKLILKPDADPAHAQPHNLLINYYRFHYCLPLDKPRELLNALNGILRQYNPDVILTSFGDTWLFSYLEETSRQTGIPFNPNRDLSRSVLRRKEISFFNYGQAHFRGEQVHLFGRWHIDSQNCMTYNDYGLLGAVEQARVTGLPVQEIARRSPGAGIAAMQTLTALRRGVLVPYQQQKGEVSKTYAQLFKADRGGLVFEPLLGIFPHVAILDFTSMYPSLMVKYNLSPETVGTGAKDAWEIPELGVKVDRRPGLVPETLKPLLEKRIAIKRLLRTMDRDVPRYRYYKSLSKALKWLLVVAYGRLGYANSTFGRINSHEAVTHLGREMLLRAKAIAEEQGFTVLHLYVDSMFLYRVGAKSAADFQDLMDEVECQTGLFLDLDEGLYQWMAFVASRRKPDQPVANRFFGLLPDGKYKIRGLALRRDDTPAFIANIQMQVLDILGREPDPAQLANLLPDVLQMVQEKLAALNKREVNLEELLVTQTLNRELNEYRVFSPLARAALQLQKTGKNLKMGQQVRFIYTKTAPGVFAWDLPASPDPESIDVRRYQELLFRAVYEVLQPVGISEATLRDWLFGRAGYITSPGQIKFPSTIKYQLPLFAGLKHMHMDSD